MSGYALVIFAIALKARAGGEDTTRDQAIWLVHGVLVLLTAAFGLAALVRHDPAMITALAAVAVADYFVRRIAARGARKPE